MQLQNVELGEGQQLLKDAKYGVAQTYMTTLVFQTHT